MYSKVTGLRMRRLGAGVLLGLLLILVVAGPVLAKGLGQEPVPPPAPVEFPALVGELVGLGGFAAIVTLLINIGKTAGWVKDGQAPTVSAVMNFIGLGILMAVRMFRPDMDVGAADQQIGSFAAVGMTILSYVMQLAVSKGTHAALAGVPVVGKSFTVDKLSALDAVSKTIQAGEQ